MILSVTVHNLSLSTYHISLRVSSFLLLVLGFLSNCQDHRPESFECNPRIQVSPLGSLVPSLSLSHMTHIIRELTVTCKLLQTACSRAAPGGPLELAALDLLKAGVNWSKQCDHSRSLLAESESQMLLTNVSYHCVTPFLILVFDPYSSLPGPQRLPRSEF